MIQGVVVSRGFGITASQVVEDVESPGRVTPQVLDEFLPAFAQVSQVSLVHDQRPKQRLGADEAHRGGCLPE